MDEISMKGNRLLLLYTIVAIAAAQFAFALYLPSLPVIAEHFHISVGMAKDSVSIYLLAFGISQLAYGPLSDYLGRKPVLMFGLFITFLGTIFVLFSHNITMFMISRLVQGTGAGSLGVITRAIVRDKFEKKGLVKALGYLVMAASVTAMITPFIGGNLEELFSWKANFYAILIYLALIFFITYFFVKETNQKKVHTDEKIKTIFANYRSLFKDFRFFAYVFCIVATFSGYFIYLSVAPFIFEETLGLTPAQYGDIAIIPPIGYFVGNFISNKLVKHTSVRKLIFFGAVVSVIAGIIFIIESEMGILTVPMTIMPVTIMSFGAGFIVANATAGMLYRFDTIAGTAASLSGAFQMIGSSFFTFLASELGVNDIFGLGIVFILMGLAIGIFVPKRPARC